jgi:hypothetical protein
MAGSRVLRCTSLLLLVGMFATLPLLAQKITGDITGDVTDSTGAVVANVAVTAVNNDTSFSRAGVTNSSGNYRVPELPIGT